VSRPARLEYRYDADHPAYVELQQQAEQFGVSLQQLINLLVVSRYNIRRGLPSAGEALWVPDDSAVPAEAAAEPVSDAGAAAIADEWL
jgi:hypothetical protein